MQYFIRRMVLVDCELLPVREVFLFLRQELGVSPDLLIIVDVSVQFLLYARTVLPK